MIESLLFAVMLFAFQDKMYFGVGQRNTGKDEYLIQLQQFPLQCKPVFENNEHQCIVGAFIKMRYEVLISSGLDTLIKYIQKRMGHHSIEFDMSKTLNESKCGILIKQKNFLENSSDAKS